MLPFIIYVKEARHLSAVKSAFRAVEVLDHFERTRVPASLKTLCGALGFPQSSTTALLKTLTAMGYLSYDIANRLYFPTMKTNAVGSWIPATLFGSGQILSAVERIHARTRETVVVVSKNDIYVQYIVTRLSTHQIRHHVGEGSMRLMTSTLLGWLLMTTLKDCEVDNLIRRCNIAAGQPISENVEEILGKVRRLREDGHGYTENAPTLGGATVGLVLPTTIQGQPVVIGCGGVLERVREHRHEYLDVLQQEVAAIWGPRG
jgi:DNA-binding IclR family transcriptional regulator